MGRAARAPTTATRTSRAARPAARAGASGGHAPRELERGVQALAGRAARPRPTCASRGGRGTPRPPPSAAARRAPRRRRRVRCTTAPARCPAARAAPGTRPAPRRRTGASARGVPRQRLLEQRRQIIERADRGEGARDRCDRVRPQAPRPPRWHGRRRRSRRRADRGIRARTAARTASSRLCSARATRSCSARSTSGSAAPRGLIAVGGGGQAAAAGRPRRQLGERAPAGRAVRIEVRAPGVGRHAQGVGHAQAAGIGAALQSASTSVALRHPPSSANARRCRRRPRARRHRGCGTPCR